METFKEDSVGRIPFESLNRTMQYGNLSPSNAYLSKKISLNRTMQYGNFFRKKDRKKEKIRLNRTMQYGN